MTASSRRARRWPLPRPRQLGGVCHAAGSLQEDEAAPAAGPARKARQGTPVQVPLADIRADLLGTQRRLAAGHGGFTRYRVLRRVFTLVADADANNQMFVRKAGDYRARPSVRRPGAGHGRGLICSEGDAWQRQRRIAQPAFGKATLARVVQTRER